MEEKPNEPGGFAQISKELLLVWPHLSDGQRLILPLLLSFMPKCFPSHQKIAVLSGRHRNSVREYLKQLEAAGLIVAEQRFRRGGGWSSKRYEVANVADPAVREAIIRKLRPSVTVPLHNHGLCSGEAETLHKHEVCSAVHNQELCSAVHNQGVFSGVHNDGVCTNGQVLTDKANGQEIKGVAAAPPSSPW